MDINTKILVAGGDLRQVFLADFLSQFFSVKQYALGQKHASAKTLKDFDILLLPMIVSTDDEFLNAPFSQGQVLLSELADCVKPKGIVFGGRLSEKAKEIFTSKGLRLYEYYNRDELVIKNCVPTAEGALQIAMEETNTTIRGLKTLVLGYGRVGKITADLFNSVGAEVTATARKLSDLALCQSLKINAKKTSEALSSPQGYDLIINTIPHLVLTRSVLLKLNKSCLIIDLASAPGGVDFDSAKEFNLKAIRALSLPPEVT